MVSQRVRIQKLLPDAVLPTYGSASAAGADLYACGEAVTIAPGETALVHTGIVMEIPQGLVGLVYARSGLATKRGLAPANKVGVVDSDYRGEIMVGLQNSGKEDYVIQPADRIAQLMVAPVIQAQVELVDELDETARGAGGFGSTGA